MRRVALVATVLATAVALAACGSGEEPADADTPDRVELTFEGGEAPPLERVEVDPGEEIEIVVTADEPGELHVHSSPGETLEYAAGTTTLKLTIDQPGVVDVESHELETLVLQLEVN